MGADSKPNRPTKETSMTTNAGMTKAPKTKTPKTPKATKPTASAAKPAEKPVKAKAAKAPADRLPTTLDELKASKGGLICYLFFTGKGREEIAREVATSFKLTDTQAGKITRRITGRARLFKRVFELMAGK